MAVYKPSWLRTWLNKLNWDILTWHIYVGDAIETGIDWTVDFINTALEWADAAYNWALAAWDKALETGRDLLTTINRQLQPLWDAIDAWRDRLSEWWFSTKDSVLAWINDARDYASDLFRQASTAIEGVAAWLDTFKRLTLPTLPNRKEVNDNIEAIIDPVRQEVNKHSSWLDLAKDFFTDPQQFLFDILQKMLERFW